MQGSVFTAFSDMIIENMGMEQWNELLEKVNPISEGIYTTGKQYDDGELLAMVGVLVEKTGLPASQLIESFGVFLFTKLYENGPVDVSSISNLKDFLKAIDAVIHVEVKRLYPDAYLPEFRYEESENTLTLFYQSKRMLCHAAIGLIKGAAKRFKEDVEIDHPECMHEGAKCCKLVVNFKE